MARTATIVRETSESKVELSLNLDGTGKTDIDTSVPFYNHMMTALGKHSLIDLTIKATGDTDIDAHHTVEDIAIVFGEALKQARAVSKRRVAAAKELAAKVTAELESLAMSGSKLEIRVSEREHLDASGADGIDFLFTPFPGSPQMPMGKSASGGELSRLMLAFELVAAEKHVVAGGSVPPMTFIFDEVDAGVGGKTAVELGARLAKLAQSAQVIVVTHLPQVASWADEQYVVAKGEMDDGSIATTINQVRGEARVHEIARMLSGSESEASLEHAEELLKSSVLD